MGFKLYFFRPTFKKKTVEDLKKIAKDDQLPEKKQKLEEALLDYLKVFDAAPQTEEIIVFDVISGNPKIKWDQTKDDDSVLDCISNLANLLAALRGTVNTSYLKTRKSTKLNTNDNNKNGGNDNETHDDTGFIQTEQIDYEIEPSVTEDAARAVIQLRNLALANAISQGRNYLTKEDAQLIIRVCFSTTKIYRAKMLNLLLENNGELTTSQIVSGLDISRPHALQTMQEFDALKVGKVSSISSYEKSERKIKLNDEFKWFLTDKFKEMYRPAIELIPDFIRQTACCKMNSQYMQILSMNLSNNHYLRACDSEREVCHTNKVNSNYERNKKNNLLQTEEDTNKIIIHDIERITNGNTSSNNEIEIDKDINQSQENSHLDNQKNTSLRVEKCFTRVTPSPETCHTVHKTKEMVPKNVIEDIIKVVKDEKGQTAANFVIELAIQASQVVKEFLKNENLTARESRKVRNILVEVVRHPNIEIVKRKPQLVVRWLDKEMMT